MNMEQTTVGYSLLLSEGKRFLFLVGCGSRAISIRTFTQHICFTGMLCLERHSGHGVINCDDVNKLLAKNNTQQ